MEEVSILETGNKTLKFIQKRWWIILGFLILGVVFGWQRGSQDPPVFETTLTGQANGISNVSVVGVLNSLQSAANTHNAGLLSEQTGMSEELTSVIWSLEASIYENKNPNEDLNNNVFYVKLTASDLSKVGKFKDGLIDFVNNDQLFNGVGTIDISPKYDQPTLPANPIQKTMLKWGILFFVLGMVISVLIDFYVKVKAYGRTTDNA